MRLEVNGLIIEVLRGSNSFGDQLVEFVTIKDGKVWRAYASRSEGDWLDSVEDYVAEFKRCKLHDHAIGSKLVK